jgi:CheY-like chemotaxis protein
MADGLEVKGHKMCFACHGRFAISWRQRRWGDANRGLMMTFMSAESTSRPVQKILVVDDNEIILKTVSLKLQGAGYQVFTALDGAEAVAAARRENPDLILLDIGFPPAVDGVPWDGFRVMDWFHRLDSARKIPIIIITGSEDPKYKERAASSGAVAFFHKPIDHDDLLKVIRSVLGDSTKPA